MSELLEIIEGKSIKFQPSAQLSAFIEEAGLQVYQLQDVLRQEKRDKLSSLLKRIPDNKRNLMETTLEELVHVIKQYEADYQKECREIANVVNEEINAFLNKRKNIFSVLQIDHRDKKNIQSFNKNFFVSFCDEVNEGPEEIKLDDYQFQNSPTKTSIKQFSHIDEVKKSYREDEHSFEEISENINGISNQQTKYNQAYNNDSDIEEDIPEEIYEHNEYDAGGNLVESSTFFDRNIEFEIPPQVLVDQEVHNNQTKVVIHQAGQYQSSKIFITSEESLDLDRDEISMTQTMGNKYLPNILEEFQSMRQELKSEQICREINYKNFQKIPINTPKHHQVDKNDQLTDSLDKIIDDSLVSKPAKKNNNNGQNMMTPNPDIDDREIEIKKLKLLGSGTQADVYSCYISKHNSNEIFVTKTKKIVNNDSIAKESLDEMKREFDIAKDLTHPNVVKYHYFITSVRDKTCEFNIILEYMEGGNLKQFIQSNKSQKNDNKLVQSITRQILEGLIYLHQRKIIHQDLKPHNILFNKSFTNIKLADFGVSHLLDKTRNTISSQCGTIRYMSPEQLDGKLTNKIDIWALGCVMLELITGLSPYFDLTNEFQIPRQTDKKVSPLDYLRKSNKFKEDDFYQMSEYVDLMKQCFIFNYEERPQAKELINHQFFTINK